jgi:hypothetical protein
VAEAVPSGSQRPTGEDEVKMEDAHTAGRLRFLRLIWRAAADITRTDVEREANRIEREGNREEEIALQGAGASAGVAREPGESRRGS